ncbi:hypothetical protein ACGF5C_31185 [Micromonospora sp. NPDC047620]|uniref:hypothetical protein n=1 Tax=Micromonospora sp. NPDC047620 TaxID=3364251 RepID=UPI003722105D
MILRVILTSRRVVIYLATIVLLSAVSWLLGKTGILINLAFPRPQIRLPYPEICAVLGGALGAVILRPRFWEWDRVASGRASIVAAAFALFGSVAPAVIVTAGALALPAGSPVAWRICNAVVMCAVIFLCSPYLGGAVTGAAAIVLYFAHGLVNNLWHNLSFVPITRLPNHNTHWITASALIALAGIAHYRTRGATAWSQRMFARDE